jgi:outer membrane protein OmpA-like peptidoglycan-associated protein
MQKMNWIQGYTMRNKMRFFAALITLAMTGCIPSQGVQGSYSTPNKNMPALAAGAVAGAAVAGVTGGTAFAVVPGGAAGIAATNAKTSLMQTLTTQGVNVIAQGDKLRLILPSDAFFYPGEPALNPEHYPVLDKVAALLKEYRQVPITITAHTDSIGSSKDKYELSQQQADSIRAYLWVHGIDYKNLHVEAYGSQRPVAADNGPKGYAANRRIEITLRAM